MYVLAKNMGKFKIQYGIVLSVGVVAKTTLFNMHTPQAESYALRTPVAVRADRECAEYMVVDVRKSFRYL